MEKNKKEGLEVQGTENQTVKRKKSLIGTLKSMKNNLSYLKEINMIDENEEAEIKEKLGISALEKILNI